MFPVTVTLRSHAQLDAVLSALRALQPDPVDFGTRYPEAPKVETKPTPVPVQVQVQATPPATVPEPKGQPTYQEAANAILALSKAKGTQKAKEVLGDFGLARLTGAKPEQYADIMAACEAA